MSAFTEIPAPDATARFSPGFGPRFIITVDTEEEFAWDQPLQRTGHTLHHLPRLKEFQNFCEEHGIVPVYMVDYPVATSPLAAAALAGAAAQGRAEVGMHLHPWVTPPHDEVVCERNSYGGNLPPELEQAKFDCLRAAVVTNFGAEPRIFRAGRYGLGRTTNRVLSRNAIAIDSSVRSRFNYSADHGPNFEKFPVVPYWLGPDRSVLELPLTTVYGGVLRRLGHLIYPALRRLPKLRGALSRLGLLDRIPLTPEGVSAKAAIKGIDRALEEGLPLLVMSFHSPSLDPAHTPYVRNEADLDRFYNWWKAILAHCASKGIRPTDISGIIEAVEVGPAKSAARSEQCNGPLAPAGRAS